MPYSQIQATIQEQATCNRTGYVWSTPYMPHYIGTTVNTSCYTLGAPATAQSTPDTANTPLLIRTYTFRARLICLYAFRAAWYGWAHSDLRYVHLHMVYK